MGVSPWKFIVVDKTYQPSDHEQKIYALWEQGGYFNPETNRNSKPYCIIMPPPNANEALHIGHARFVAVQDILIRFFRMRGFSTLWLPGTDHAGIETQYVFEKKLAEEGKSRFDYDRETLYQMIWDYVQKYRGIAVEQMKRLGASAGWEREKFTLDQDVINIVHETFKRLVDGGLIYRGERLVNFCVHCGTSFSELEVDHKEKEGALYILNYGIARIATTRPETIFADVAVAVNPKDKRYKGLVGKNAIIPLINVEIPIVSDHRVDMEFGTGALKITPAHDKTDYLIGKDHNLESIQIIDGQGRLENHPRVPQDYRGLTVKQARQKIVEGLGKNLIEKRPYIHSVAVCYRCKNIIEPLPSTQWFLKTRGLADKAIEAVKQGKTKFVTGRFEKIYNHWLKNLEDWNISRQIVWGIRIPAWQCGACNQWVITDGKAPVKCSHCDSINLTQDPDTFDTWFSSAQWPVITLKTTKVGDFEKFYPTDVMETGYDILPFWVVRMMMLGLYMTGDVPFKTIFLHGLVRDAKGEKISKSKGNVINPLEMAEKYGTDALRIALVWGALAVNDISLSEDNIRGQRNFTNKIWNIARYILSQPTNSPEYDLQSLSNHPDSAWILEELNKATTTVTAALEQFRLHDAAGEVYGFIWHKLADVYIEKTKGWREDAQPTLTYVLQESLKLLHPFMPFVTETIWQIARQQFSATTPLSKAYSTTTRGSYKPKTNRFFSSKALIVANWTTP